MIIRSIRLVNFGLYAGEQCIEPAVGQNGKGSVTLVGGLNGRGKTSLLEAVLLVLYGNRSPMARERNRTYSSYLQGLIHKGAPPSQGSVVELTIEVLIDGDPNLLRIRRSWKVANVRAVERLEVWRDGVDDTYLAANWDTYVEELVPSGVSSLFFFDGEKISTIAEEEETSEALRVAIRSLLGLDLVDLVIADLNTTIKRNHASARRIEGADRVVELEDKVTQLETTRSRLNQEIADIETKIQYAEGVYSQKEQNYLQLGGSVATNRDELQRQQQALQEQLARARAGITSIAAGPLPLLLVLPLLEEIWQSTSADDQIQTARMLLPLLQERDQRVLEQLRTNGVDLVTLSKFEDLLNSERSELEIATTAEQSHHVSAVGKGQLQELLRNGQAMWRQSAQQLLDRYQEMDDKLEHVNQHLLFRVNTDSVSTALKDLADITKHISDLQHQHGVLQRELKVVNVALAQTLKQRKTALDTAIRTADHEDSANRNIALALRSQETMLAFSQVVAKRKISEFAESVTGAFLELTHKTGLVSAVRIEPETLHFSLHDSAGEDVPKSRLSSGEKQMLAVAILWGLARASRRELPVIIDTPMGRLDSSHRMNFIARYLPNASHQVLVLSTDTEIVGPYLETLNGAIGRQYLLQYDEALRRTTVTDGYFPNAQEAAV